MNLASESLLRQGLSDLGMAVDEIDIQKLIQFSELLLKWNRVYNLTAITEPHEVVTKHLLDSATFASYLIKEIPTEFDQVLDVGCGGGLPGIPSAILCPTKNFTLIDSVGKKIAFVNRAKVLLNLNNLTAINERVEKNVFSQSFDLISSRAFSSLELFTSLTQDLIKENGYWLAMKAKISKEELSALPENVRIEGIIPLKVPFLNEERNLVIMQKRN